MDLIGDYIYFAPSHEVADIHSKYAPVYMYEFAYRQQTTKFNTNKKWMGVVYGDNVVYDFGIPMFHKFLPYYTLDDRQVVPLSWQCTQTSPRPPIQHHSQSAAEGEVQLELQGVSERVCRQSFLILFCLRFRNDCFFVEFCCICYRVRFAGAKMARTH